MEKTFRLNSKLTYMTSKGGRIMWKNLYAISNILLWLVFITHVIIVAYYVVKLEKIKEVKKWQKVIFTGMIITISIIVINFILGLIVHKNEFIDLIYVCLISAIYIMIYINVIDVSNLIIKINKYLKK